MIGRFNDMSSANENKQQNITVEPLFKKGKNTAHIPIHG
jgi:hypothetical protein